MTVLAIAACLAAMSMGCGRVDEDAAASHRIEARSGKRVASVDLACSVENAVLDASGSTRADLVMEVRPFRDVANASIEFVLPQGWRPVCGATALKADLAAGAGRVFRLQVEIAPGAAAAGAGRVRAIEGTREGWFFAGPYSRPELGRLEQDDKGNAVRVFPAGAGE